MITKETFKKIVLAIAEHGMPESRVIDNTEYKAYKINELTLILSKHGNKWAPEGISFELFAKDFFISPDGSITVSDRSGQDLELFALKDFEIVAVVASFLKWRLSVITKLKA